MLAPLMAVTPLAQSARMCTYCDDTSPDDVVSGLIDDIDTYGWALVWVDGPEGIYAYTIGLQDHVGHPDLIVLDVSEDVAAPLLNSMVDLLGQQDQHARRDLARSGLCLVEGHPDHLIGPLFTMWVRCFEHRPKPGDIVQVVVPESWLCPLHAMARRRLDISGPLVPAIGGAVDDG